MSVEVRLGPTLGLGKPQRLFAFSPQQLGLWCIPNRCYDVAPDGQLFYATQPLPAPSPPPVTQIQLVMNWVEELKARVAAGQAK